MGSSLTVDKQLVCECEIGNVMDRLWEYAVKKEYIVDYCYTCL